MRCELFAAVLFLPTLVFAADAWRAPTSQQIDAVYPQVRALYEILPGPHSSLFAPDEEPSLKTGILVETTAVLELLGK